MLFTLLAALVGGLASCGIETYKYLERVDPGIPMRLNTTAYIELPDESERDYFRFFIIYYRIYISDLPVEAVDTGLLAQINPALHSDYNYFLSYTNSQSTVAPSNMDAIFGSRKYFSLELIDASIDSVLAIDSGDTITLDFSANPQFKPSLILGDTRATPGAPRHQLSRNKGNNNSPYARNYYFVNSEDINDSSHISSSSDSSNINQDVQKNDQSGAGPKYTYASMYIAAHGLDDTNFTNIYSIPTFIGIFRLPDE